MNRRIDFSHYFCMNLSCNGNNTYWREKNIAMVNASSSVWTIISNEVIGFSMKLNRFVMYVCLSLYYYIVKVLYLPLLNTWRWTDNRQKSQKSRILFGKSWLVSVPTCNQENRKFAARWSWAMLHSHAQEETK